jgi:hypothetical protein
MVESVYLWYLNIEKDYTIVVVLGHLLPLLLFNSNDKNNNNQEKVYIKPVILFKTKEMKYNAANLFIVSYNISNWFLLSMLTDVNKF